MDQFFSADRQRLRIYAIFFGWLATFSQHSDDVATNQTDQPNIIPQHPLKKAVIQNRDSIALSLKEASEKLLKQGNQVKKQIANTSSKSNVELIKSVNRNQNEIRQGISNLELIGTTWNLIEENNKDVITFLADGQILGYGRANDYWEISSNRLILYTGGDKNTWTRKWESQVGNFFSGTGKKRNGASFEWKLVKKE